MGSGPEHVRRRARRRVARVREAARLRVLRLRSRVDHSILGPTQRSRRVTRALVTNGMLRLRAVPHRSEAQRAERRLRADVNRLPKPLTPSAGVAIIRARPDDDPRWVAEAVSATTEPLVAIVRETVEPVEEKWLERLTAVIDRSQVNAGVVAATPLVVHPCRPLRKATPQDGRVRHLGLALHATADGLPAAAAYLAGSQACPSEPVIEVVSAGPSCIVVDRWSYDRVGGLADLPDLDSAIFDLSWRLQSGGQRVLAVPSAVVRDVATVASPQELTHPIEPGGAAWHRIVEDHGPALLRRALGDTEGTPARLGLTVAAPSAKAAPRWGDWHLAEALADSLRREGHPTVVQTLDRADSGAARSQDVHLVVRGLAPVRRTSGQRHVLWVISHPESVDARECDEADLVLVASERFAEELGAVTTTPVEVLLQATDHRRFRRVRPDPRHTHDLAVVARTRGVMRPAVADALAAGLRPAIYGGGWDAHVEPSLIVTDHVPNADLAIVYSSIGILLNDHWPAMRERGFVSNRLFDALACGTTVISDDLPELDDLFDGAVATYGSSDELRTVVQETLADPQAARQRAERGREAVLTAHTFDQRARELLANLERHGLLAH